MKILIALLFISTITQAQVSTELGMSSRISPTLKAAIEVPLNQFNIELGTMVSADNYNPVMSLQAGYSFIVDRYNQELRLAVSGNYHFGLLPTDKDVRCQKFLPGASLRFKWSCGVFMIADFNGETGKVGIGYLFAKK